MAARPFFTPVAQKLCEYVSMLYSQARSVFILERYFASKLFAALRGAFNNLYPNKNVPNKTRIHRLVKKNFGTPDVFVTIAEITAVPISVSVSDNRIRLQDSNTASVFVVVCAKAFIYSRCCLLCGIFCTKEGVLLVQDS